MSFADNVAPQRFHFIKYHGLGNDFAVFKGGMADLPSPQPDTVRQLCARGKGIGADGIIIARRSETADVRMELINSDGTIPQMCGNGLRCFVKYCVEELAMSDSQLDVETEGGVRRCFSRLDDHGRVDRVKVDMGPPTFERSTIPMSGAGPALEIDVEADGRVFQATGVNTGNPHLVTFCEPSTEIAVRYGPILEQHPLWPAKANVEFVAVRGPQHLEVVVWERACGLTQACGTGATASAAAACKLGKAAFDTPITVSLPGGQLDITIENAFRTAWMAGPVVKVYEGMFDTSPSTGQDG